jgi:hypothetical protein
VPGYGFRNFAPRLPRWNRLSVSEAALRVVEGVRQANAAAAAGRAAIAAGQKARWQKVNAAKSGSQSSGDTPTAAAAPRSRRKRPTMSAAARKAVSERMRKYWAARRKQGAKTPTHAGSARRSGR